MKKVIGILTLVIAVVGFSAMADAALLFVETFDTEIPGINKTDFTQWNVTDGTVDLIGSGGSGTMYDYVPGNGYYVDLDGSTRDAGLLTQKTAINYMPGYEYEVVFSLAGNNVPLAGYPSDTVNVSLALGTILNENITLLTDDPFQIYTRNFTVAAPTLGVLQFGNLGGDNVGILLDNVSISSRPVPEPISLVLFGTGLLGLFLRRKF